MHHNSDTPRSELDDYLARQALLLHPTSTEACTELGADESSNPNTNPTGGILVGVVLGLSAWALIALALLSAYLPG